FDVQVRRGGAADLGVRGRDVVHRVAEPVDGRARGGAVGRVLERRLVLDQAVRGGGRPDFGDAGRAADGRGDLVGRRRRADDDGGRARSGGVVPEIGRA